MTRPVQANPHLTMIVAPLGVEPRQHLECDERAAGDGDSHPPIFSRGYALHWRTGPACVMESHPSYRHYGRTNRQWICTSTSAAFGFTLY